MIWVSIILGIIEAIPSIITIIKDILAAIHGQPAHVLAFQQLLLRHADYVDPSKALADLQSFHAQHVPGSAFAAPAAAGGANP